MAKNKDSKTINRTGLFDYEGMTILYEDKNGKYLFDVKGMLKDLDGEYISITAATDTDPNHVID